LGKDDSAKTEKDSFSNEEREGGKTRQRKKLETRKTCTKEGNVYGGEKRRIHKKVSRKTGTI